MRAKTFIQKKIGGSYIHISFDEIDEFVPRIPKNRCQGEDAGIRRICAAPDVLSALNAIPGAGMSLLRAKEAGFSPVLHVYRLWPEAGGLMEAEDVSRYVPDAEITGEVWLTKKPVKTVREDYRIVWFIWEMLKDPNGDDFCHIGNIHLKRTTYTNNWEKFFLDIYGKKPENLVEKVAEVNVSFRSFLLNLDEEMLGMIREKQRKTARQHAL